MGSAGSGGMAGQLRLTASQVNTNGGNNSVLANGGTGGNQNANTPPAFPGPSLQGNGGNGSFGGAGGSIGGAGNGGGGGSVTISLPRNTVPATQVNVNGGAGGAQNGNFGVGGMPFGGNGTRGPAGFAGSNGFFSMAPLDWESDSIDLFNKKVKQWKQKIASTHRQTDDESDTSGDTGNNSMFDPVAYVQPMPSAAIQAVASPDVLLKISGVTIVVESKIDIAVVARLSGAVRFSRNSNSVFTMQSGAALFAPQGSSLVLSTPEGDVYIESGCKTLVHVSNGYVAVLNLRDGHAGQVRLMHGKTVVNVAVGKELVIGPDRGANLPDVNPTPEIAVRDIKSHVIGTTRVFIGDFSIMSALMNHAALRGLSKSSEPAHKKQLAQLLKNAIVLSYVTAKHGSYKTTR